VTVRSLAFVVGVAACGRVDFGPYDPATCANTIEDLDEAGIDCGGACSRQCPSARCDTNTDCATDRCVSGRCELASGPPFWLPGPALATPRVGMQCASVGGAVYAVGGRSGLLSADALATVEMLASGATVWVAAPSLATPRYGHAVAATIDGTIYAMGGDTLDGSFLDSLEAFTGSWTTRRPEGQRTGIAAAGGLDGRLYIVDNVNTGIYEPATDGWTSGPPPVDQRDGSSAARGRDGRVYAVGGYSRITGMAAASVDAWDVSTAMWRSVARLPTARQGLASVAAPDGRIYAIGGDFGGNTGASVVEAYAPGVDHWSSVASLATPRDSHGAAIGGDGRIYVVGGESAGVPLQDVEVYGPVITVSPTTGAPGASITVTGSNFAADAPIHVAVDDVVVVAGVTDANGAASLGFVVPAIAAGAHAVTVADIRSQYPVSATLQVP
jgi:hypothetical protein